MKVTIITVTYNSERYLDECIQSVLEQEHCNIEYIIVDGASTDGTIEIAKSYEGRISRVISEPDKGIYDAMNKGIRLATGDIIGILNSDDIFNNRQIINDVVGVFKSNPDIGAVFGNIIYFRTEEPEKVVRLWKSKPYCDNFFESGNVPPHPSLFVKKEVYDKIGLYHPDFKISSDYEFMLRMMKVYNYTSIYLDKIIVRMRMGGASTKNISNILLGNKEIMESWRMNQMKLPRSFFLRKFLIKALQLVKLNVE
jgi:glycosyltransferase